MGVAKPFATLVNTWALPRHPAREVAFDLAGRAAWPARPPRRWGRSRPRGRATCRLTRSRIWSAPKNFSNSEILKMDGAGTKDYTFFFKFSSCFFKFLRRSNRKTIFCPKKSIKFFQVFSSCEFKFFQLSTEESFHLKKTSGTLKTPKESNFVHFQVAN